MIDQSTSDISLPFKRFTALCGGDPTIMSDVLCNQSQEQFLENYCHQLGVNVTPYLTNPTEEMRKMQENGQKFRELMWKEPSDFEIEIKADPALLTARDLRGDTILLYAANVAGKLRGTGRSYAIINSLITSGAKIGDRNCNGMTAIHIAAKNSYDRVTAQSIFPQLVYAALDQKLDLNQSDSHGRTALHFVASHCYTYYNVTTDNARFLLEKCHEISVSPKDTLGFTPLDYAIIDGKWTLVATLIKAGADPLAGICQEKRDIDDLINAAIERERLINDPNSANSSKTQNVLPCSLEKLEVHYNKSKGDLKSLIDIYHNAFKIRFLDQALHEFLCCKLREVVAEIDSNDINVQDENGYTLLHVAVMSDQEDIIISLLQKGAWPQKNKNGVTPLLLAFMSGSKVFLTLLENRIPLPEFVERDEAQVPIPFLYTCSMRCKSSAILGKVFDLNQSMLHNKFSMIVTHFGELKEETSDLLTVATPVARFELLKRGVKFELDT